jgi:exopolyphosphatase/guanosine-5'-triphosphate,3'-diphosphate pyrophosphatase
MSFVAAIDCGSNSFHLMIAKTQANSGYEIVERCKEHVQLREGLRADGSLSPSSQERALQCFKTFRSFLDRYPIARARVVGTYTLRAAVGIEDLIQKGSQVLGLPIDIISGEEEARLIHQGALSHGAIPGTYLIIDIGGGSTELIVGQEHQLQDSISLEMGCVEYQLTFFKNGKMRAQAFDEAVRMAMQAVRPFAHRFTSTHFKRCLGGSGTLRGLMGILFHDQLDHQKSITRQELENVRDHLIQIEDVDRIELENLRKDRHSVLAGGLSVLLGLFYALDIHHIELSHGALREGLLLELL